MRKEQKDTLTVRVTSVGFSILVFALFKPLEMEVLGWRLYLHLVAIWVVGVGVCYITEAILKYIVRMPAAFDKGAEYIIRRNLWFQLINTPLIALMVCAYLHFAAILSGVHMGTPLLSWTGYLTMLLIIAFCSFTIGLYWRFKFRSRYLAAELEEVRLLNEELRMRNEESTKKSATSDAHHSSFTLKGSTSDSLTLSVADLLYVESIGNYVKVYHLQDGEVRADVLRATSKQMEEALGDHHMVVRCHRAFLVNLSHVERVVSQSGNMHLQMRHSHDTLPVSRSNMPKVKAALAQ